jgi:hypothetical protein
MPGYEIVQSFSGEASLKRPMRQAIAWAARVGVVTARQSYQLDLRMGLLKVVRRCSPRPASPRVDPIDLALSQLRPDRRTALRSMAADKVGEQCAAGKTMGLPVGAAAPSSAGP